MGENSGALLPLPNGQVGQFIKGPGKPGQSSSRLTLKMSNGNAQGAGQTLKVQQGQVSGGGTSFNHVLTGKGIGNSLKIRRDQRGRVKGVTHTQEHHIISNKTSGLRDHVLWEKAGLHPNRTPNKMLLPTKEGAKLSTTTRSIHQGRHRESVHKRLLKEMDGAIRQGEREGWSHPQYQNALKNIIREERKVLKSGDRILNKNHRPWAKDQD